MLQLSPGNQDGAHLKALESFLGRAYSALKPGGLLIFDFLGRRPGRPRRRDFLAAGEDWIVSGRVSEGRGIITRRIETVLFTRRARRLSVETHKQLRLGHRMIERSLRKTGFRFRLLRGYGNRPLPPGHLLAVAAKPVR